MFILIAVLAYAFNAISTVIDKILLKKSIPEPFVYTFYINILGLLALFLIFFGFQPNLYSIIYGSLSGIVTVLALLTYFKSLKITEASIAGPVVGSLNPLFSLVIGALVFGQFLTNTQYLACILIILGGVIITLNLWLKKIKLGPQLFYMVSSGFFFAVAAVLLRQTFLYTDLLTGIVLNRVGAGIFVLLFLLIPKLRSAVFANSDSIGAKKEKHDLQSKSSLFLLLFGQAMGAASGFLISVGIFLANPALINSFFGVQYLVILLAAVILAKKNANLLEETLTKKSILQKIIGAAIISLGLYFLLK